MNIIIGLFAGLLFGAGLIISGMADPAKVLGFLDITGTWDPTLAFVMGGALTTTAIGFRVVTRREKPVYDESFHIPTTTAIDKKLLSGAILFGVGWGLVGLCPGPAIVAIGSLKTEALIFGIAMCIGLLLAGAFNKPAKT